MACGRPFASGARRDDADALPFQHREGHGAEVEDDVVHVRGGAGLGDADVARDLRHRGRGAVEQVDARLGGGGRRADAAARALVRFGDERGRLVVERVDRLATACAAGSSGRGGSSCQVNCSSRLKGASTWNQLSMAPVGQGATQSMQKLQVPDVHDVVVVVVGDRVDRAGRLAGVAPDADLGVDQVLLDRRPCPCRRLHRAAVHGARLSPRASRTRSRPACCRCRPSAGRSSEANSPAPSTGRMSETM